MSTKHVGLDTRVYVTGSHAGYAFSGVVSGVLTIVSGVITIVSVGILISQFARTPQAAAPEGGWVGFFALCAFFLLSSFGTIKYLWRIPYEIHVECGGIICFKRVLNQLRLPAQQILEIEKKMVSGEDGDVPELRLRHTRGTIQTDYFAESEALIEHLKRLNWMIQVKGSWNLPSPPSETWLDKWLDKLFGEKGEP